MEYLERLRHAANVPGTWGELLAAGAFVWIAAGLALPDWAPAESPSIAGLTQNLGAGWCATWTAGVAVLSIISIATGHYALRIVSSCTAMCTWLFLAAVVCWRSGALAPAVGVYTMLAVACFASTRAVDAR